MIQSTAWASHNFIGPLHCELARCLSRHAAQVVRVHGPTRLRQLEVCVRVEVFRRVGRLKSNNLLAFETYALETH